MASVDDTNVFFEAAKAWVCDGYHLDIRYIGGTSDGEPHIWDAIVGVHPLPPKLDLGFRIESEGFVVGQDQRGPLSRESLTSFLEQAAAGRLEVHGRLMTLYGGEKLSFYSETIHRDRWFSNLHLQVSSDRQAPWSPTELARLDNALRRATPPFDGLTDVTSWLDVKAPGTGSFTTVTLRVNPPVDLLLEKCELVEDLLNLELIAHWSFEPKHFGLAIRCVPGEGLGVRQQMADKVIWAEPEQELKKGTLQIKLKDAANVLVMLSIDQSTVRRHWLLDKAKARNNRLLAVQHFDRDLRMIRNALFESTDPAKFENGVAAVLFLLGFTPVVQLETDSPDLIVTTPAGRMGVVECTTRIADFSTKLGKLIDRRMSLSKVLATETAPAVIAAVLVCRLPRDQIAIDEAELKRRQIILMTSEDLNEAFDRTRFPTDPDKVLDNALAELRDTQ